MASMGKVVRMAPKPYPAATIPVAKPRRSGNQRTIRPTMPMYTMPVPMPQNKP
ncbi:Uncharacterised protein [Mycobacterium tuberculosis]|nr:Uncharacterised protein [Mycobacterium tuberculosis]